jgi:pimeloyl-ACP methyl ester carboxylesterase
MEALIKGRHVGQVFCLIHVGNMPDWKTRYSTKLFAAKVTPHLRDLRSLTGRHDCCRDGLPGPARRGQARAGRPRWLRGSEQPIPDIFSFLPPGFAQCLFHDRAQGEALLTGGLDLKNPAALTGFYITNSKRLSMASKILFPIPNRGLAKRLYRLTAPTLLLWGKRDRLIPPVCAERFRTLIPPHAELVLID